MEISGRIKKMQAVRRQRPKMYLSTYGKELVEKQNKLITEKGKSKE